jgi:multidrug efflux pump
LAKRVIGRRLGWKGLAHAQRTFVMTTKSFTDFFIERPIFAWVVNVILVLLGITAFFQLSTRQYPMTEPTLVTVRAHMDGSSETLVEQVTKPMEQAFAGLPNLENQSTETQKGEVKARLTFLAGTKIDGAVSDVLQALERAKMPENMERPQIVKGDIDAPSVMEIVLVGDERVPLSLVYDTADKVVRYTFESVPGVATVETAGGSEQKMQISLDPLRMQTYQVTALEIKHALSKQNFRRSVGSVISQDAQFSLTVDATRNTPQDFGQIVIQKHDDRLVRLADVAEINIEPADENVKVYHNGKPGVALTLRPQSNANPIEISKIVQEKINILKDTVPEGISIHVVIDKAFFIEDSIYQVYRTIFEAVILVLLVILIFLRSFRASLVPLITIPISLIGTFFLMWIMGFTLNVLSLLALVLAIGLVVDDAIVVLENIYRYIEQGKSPFQAAVLGSREIRFSVIAMTLTLAAVYAPIAITPGVVGKVFREFALTLAGAVLVSGFTALTLSPPMCARLLRLSGQHHGHGATLDGLQAPSMPTGLDRLGSIPALAGLARMLKGMHAGLQQWSLGIERGLAWLDTQYGQVVRWVLCRKALVLASAIFFSVATSMVGWQRLGKELSPPVDEGLLYVRFPQIGLKNIAYLERRAPALDGILAKYDDLSSRLTTLQTFQDSYVQTQLKPWNQRRPCRDLARAMRSDMEDNLQGLAGNPYCPSGSIVSSGSSQFPLSMRLLSDRSANELRDMGRFCRRVLKNFPGIAQADISEVASVPEIMVSVKDHSRLEKMGISAEEVANTLQASIRGANVGRFEKDDRQHPVHIQFAKKYRSSIEALQNALFVQGRDPKTHNSILIPLKEVMSFELKQGDPVIDRHQKKQSYLLQAALEPGVSLGEVWKDFQTQIKKELPKGYDLEPSGELKRYLKEQGTIYLIFGLALAFIFLVMAAQFESLRDPLIILLTVPLALTGAFLGLMSLSTGSLNIYSQIGLITLVGLITKHGILLVDFANQNKEAGMSVQEAIMLSCRLRLRPILMTTLAMVLGALPLALATGPGAEARQQIGTVIVGGMTLGTLFTLFVIPVVYVTLTRRTLLRRAEA